MRVVLCGQYLEHLDSNSGRVDSYPGRHPANLEPGDVVRAPNIRGDLFTVKVESSKPLCDERDDSTWRAVCTLVIGTLVE